MFVICPLDGSFALLLFVAFAMFLIYLKRTICNILLELIWIFSYTLQFYPQQIVSNYNHPKTSDLIHKLIIYHNYIPIEFILVPNFFHFHYFNSSIFQLIFNPFYHLYLSISPFSSSFLPSSIRYYK